MKTRHLALALIALSTALFGCPTPYAMSYRAVVDPDSPTLAREEGIEHRWVDDMNAASAEMYRAGYVMVGYSDMIGTHISPIAPPAAKNWGRTLEASKVLQYQHGQRYLATYWRPAKGFVLGAYYDDPPEKTRSAIGTDAGVMVQEVVQQSPAAAAFLSPGDLLLRLDDDVIAGAHWLDAELGRRAGKRVVFTVWPIRGDGLKQVAVELGGLAHGG